MTFHGGANAWLTLLQAVLLCALAGEPAARALDAAALEDRYAALREQLAHSPFERPLHLESFEADGQLRGEIYAQIEQPYRLIAPPLRDVKQWCDILILHLNVKGCRASSEPTGDRLSLSIGRKFDQPLADAHQIDFLYEVMAVEPDYLAIQLTAPEGPLGTTGYVIALQAAPIDAERSFIHLSYAYEYGTAARLAMQGYLATAGRNKVGFTITGRTDDGRPIHIGGMRGVVERNVMRYYLAIEAYLGALSTPPAQRAEQRLNAWYTAVAAYPAQLHELERADYLNMKRKEIRRQQQSNATATED